MEDTKHKRKSLAITTTLLVALLFLMFYAGYSYIYPPKHENTTIYIEIMQEHLEEFSASLSSSKESIEETEPEENILTNDEEEVIVPKGSESKNPVEKSREKVHHTEILSKETTITGGTQKISTSFKTTMIQKDKIDKVYKVGNSDTTTVGIIRFRCRCDESHYHCKNQKVIQGTEAYYWKSQREMTGAISYKGY